MTTQTTLPAPVQAVIDAGAEAGIDMQTIRQADAAFIVVAGLDGAVDVRAFIPGDRVASALHSIADSLNDDHELRHVITLDDNQVLALASYLGSPGQRPELNHNPDLVSAANLVYDRAADVINAERETRRAS